MLRRLLAGVVQRSAPIILNKPPTYQNAINLFPLKNFSMLNVSVPLFANPKVQAISDSITRTVTKYSWSKGKRKSVKPVLKRFYRLDWGMWIHTKCGRNKKLWKKHGARKRRLRQHVFCNATQCTLLDKMVTSYWRKPKYYVEDPYEPYHTREEFMFTYKKPKPFLTE